MTLVNVIEVLFPKLSGRIEVGKPFPCPLAMHMPGDDQPMFIAIEDGGERWRCEGGCAGNDWKNVVMFIQNAMGMVALDAFGLWSELDQLKSQRERVAYIKTHYPKWYPRGVQS